MIEFTNDEAVKAELAKHAETFELFRSVLKFCQSPIKPGAALSIARRDGIDDAVVWVSFTQYVKLWRLGAAVARLARSGHAYEAEALVRSMYETALLVEFILRRQVHPKENGKRLAHGQRPFSSSFRAKMYIAHTVLRKAKWAHSASATRGLKRLVPDSVRNRLEADVQPLERVVGRFWTKRLRNSPSGMSISALSETLGAKKLYESLYRARSSSVHPSDADRFLEESQGQVSLRLVPPTSVPQIVGESTGLLLHGAFWVAKRLQAMDLNQCKELLGRIDQVCAAPYDET